MTEYWWQDLCDRDNNWQGLEFTLKKSHKAGPVMDMLSGRYGRMALQISGGFNAGRSFWCLGGV